MVGDYPVGVTTGVLVGAVVEGGSVVVEIGGGVVVVCTVGTVATGGRTSPVGVVVAVAVSVGVNVADVAVGAGVDVTDEGTSFGFVPHPVSTAMPTPTNAAAAVVGHLCVER
jgi:hypothetical protein